MDLCAGYICNCTDIRFWMDSLHRIKIKWLGIFFSIMASIRGVGRFKAISYLSAKCFIYSVMHILTVLVNPDFIQKYNE